MCSSDLKDTVRNEGFLLNEEGNIKRREEKNFFLILFFNLKYS